MSHSPLQCKAVWTNDSLDVGSSYICSMAERDVTSVCKRHCRMSANTTSAMCMCITDTNEICNLQLMQEVQRFQFAAAAELREGPAAASVDVHGKIVVSAVHTVSGAPTHVTDRHITTLAASKLPPWPMKRSDLRALPCLPPTAQKRKRTYHGLGRRVA
jgi:hypothetical protein